ncbi:DDB1- and CUL4-associated factor 8-like, partial [Manduca sexta]|uniref:DDB1- and CUL4-associated factor 8-like n=1 Tax=Manduca sexta TaxID=7130 RepID=UPI00189052FC
TVPAEGRGAAIPLYSVHGHPLDLRQLVVAGRDKFVRVYDRRKASKPLALYCPSGFTEDNTNTKKKMRLSMMHLTCAIYNHDGTEILGSYNDEDIYLFNTKMMFTSKATPTRRRMATRTATPDTGTAPRSRAWRSSAPGASTSSPAPTAATSTSGRRIRRPSCSGCRRC